MTPSPELALLMIAIAALALSVIAYRVGVRHGGLTANAALRECQAQMMRGAAVATWARPTSAPRADAHYNHILTERGQLLLTDEAFAEARTRADKLLPS